MPQVIQVEGLSNQEFFEQHAAPGRIGLVGGSTFIDRLIHRGQRHVIPNARWSVWSHTFVFEGRRLDDYHWVLESDLAFHRKHIRLGAQENRLTKYFDDANYNAVAVLDLGLSPEQVKRLFERGLDLVASRARYSLREIFGTLWALRHPVHRPRENRLARDEAFYCSAFVRHLFSHAGVELSAGIAVKNTTPEDIAQTAAAQKKWVMVRPAAALPSVKTLRRIRAKQGLN